MNNRYLTAVVSFVIFGALMLSGCGGAYDAEKAYWHTAKKHAAVLQDPRKASAADFQATVADLKRIVKRYPAWERSAEIQYFLGEMNAARDDFKSAQDEYAKVDVNFPQNYGLCARSLFSVGQMQERQNDWQSALKTYNQIVERYPQSPAGLEVPLYVAKRFSEMHDPESSRKAIDGAIRMYMNLYEQNPYDNQVPVLQYLIVTAYASTGKWNEAVGVLEKMAAKYPGAEGAPIALYRVATIYRDALKQPDKAMAVYRRIINEFPKSKLGKNVQMDIGNLSIMQGDIEQSQKEFGKIFDKYADDTSLCAAAQLSVAAAFEKSGRWNEALKEYRKLQQNYPRTNEGLLAPLQIARHYLAGSDQAAADKAVTDAVAYYTGVLAKKPDRATEIAAYDYLANACGMQNRWPEAINALSAIRQRYPGDPRAAVALLKIGVVYQEKLQDSNKARETYTLFVKQYPSHNLTNLVRNLIEKLDQ